MPSSKNKLLLSKLSIGSLPLWLTMELTWTVWRLRVKINGSPRNGNMVALQRLDLSELFADTKGLSCNVKKSYFPLELGHPLQEACMISYLVVKYIGSSYKGLTTAETLVKYTGSFCKGLTRSKDTWKAEASVCSCLYSDYTGS